MGNSKKRQTKASMQELPVVESPPLAADLPKEREVFAMTWTEYERGWGCRPDGYSLHKSFNDAALYVCDYFSRMPATAPDEYSQPDGPLGSEVYVWKSALPSDSQLARDMERGYRKNGYRVFASYRDDSEYQQARSLLRFEEKNKTTINPNTYVPQ